MTDWIEKFTRRAFLLGTGSLGLIGAAPKLRPLSQPLIAENADQLVTQSGNRLMTEGR